eukprot:TRINITY_DN2307_c0_g1_i3.p1 TRINITY_DN2307_c0_g1~~TRINITY_DN2307_c0_g1_i3.p1  ORF type:complete len:165 (-),score=46.92 TRINITY_DN2307_c0_g1_i3:96-590(-)
MKKRGAFEDSFAEQDEKKQRATFGEYQQTGGVEFLGLLESVSDMTRGEMTFTCVSSVWVDQLLKTNQDQTPKSSFLPPSVLIGTHDTPIETLYEYLLPVPPLLRLFCQAFPTHPLTTTYLQQNPSFLSSPSTENGQVPWFHICFERDQLKAKGQRRDLSRIPSL